MKYAVYSNGNITYAYAFASEHERAAFIAGMGFCTEATESNLEAIERGEILVFS